MTLTVSLTAPPPSSPPASIAAPCPGRSAPLADAMAASPTGRVRLPCGRQAAKLQASASRKHVAACPLASLSPHERIVQSRARKPFPRPHWAQRRTRGMSTLTSQISADIDRQQAALVAMAFERESQHQQSRVRAPDCHAGCHGTIAPLSSHLYADVAPANGLDQTLPGQSRNSEPEKTQL